MIILEPRICSASVLTNIIFQAANFQKKVYEKYHPKYISEFECVCDYFIYKEYGVLLNQENEKYFYEYEIQKYSLEIHEEGTIYKAIMDNDVNALILFTEQEGFDKDQNTTNKLYPYIGRGLSLLELCWYHGPSECFKLLRSKLNTEITPTCLKFSFFGGKPDIMNECLQFQRIDKDCTDYAIASHNIDFITFLMNQIDLFSLWSCCEYYNLHAFFEYLNRMNDLIRFFVMSPWFGLPSLCEYLLNHGADVNSNDGSTALHTAAELNMAEVAQFLISRSAIIDSKDTESETPLHRAVMRYSIETAEVLLSNGADVL